MIGDYWTCGSEKQGIPTRQVVLVVLPHFVLMGKEYGIFRRTQLLVSWPAQLAQSHVRDWGFFQVPLKTASLSRLPVRL